MISFVFTPDIRHRQHGWTDVPDTPEIPPVTNPFMAVRRGQREQPKPPATASCRRTRSYRARVQPPGRRSRGGQNSSRPARCSRPTIHRPLSSFVPPSASAPRPSPILTTEVARLGYLLLLASAAGENAILAKRYALVAALRPVATMAPTCTAGRPFWTACRCAQCGARAWRSAGSTAGGSGSRARLGRRSARLSPPRSQAARVPVRAAHLSGLPSPSTSCHRLTRSSLMDMSPDQAAALTKVRAWLARPGQQQIFRLFGYAGTGKTRWRARLPPTALPPPSARSPARPPP